MVYETTLCHYGIKGQKWGIRRFQNKDGTLTEEGKRLKREMGGASKYAAQVSSLRIKYAKTTDPKVKKQLEREFEAAYKKRRNEYVKAISIEREISKDVGPVSKLKLNADGTYTDRKGRIISKTVYEMAAIDQNMNSWLSKTDNRFKYADRASNQEIIGSGGGSVRTVQFKGIKTTNRSDKEFLNKTFNNEKKK